jgi:pimeloyl-ACP methyl ester carboxylesterase
VAGQLTLWGHVFAVDLRGHGESQWSAAGTYDTASVAEDIALVIEQLGRPADVVGLAWGGLVAIRLANRHPGLVRRLAVLDIPTRFAASPDDVPPSPYEFSSRSELLAWEREVQPAASDRLLALIADHGVRPSTTGGLARTYDMQFTRRWPFRAENFDADWAAVTAPTLLVRAEHSTVFSEAEFAAMLDRQSRASGLTIAGGGDQLVVDRPIELADALETFLHEEALDASVIGDAKEMLEIP